MFPEDAGYSKYGCSSQSRDDCVKESSRVKSCYCLGDLCNGAERKSLANVGIVAAVVIVGRNMYFDVDMM